MTLTQSRKEKAQNKQSYEVGYGKPPVHTRWKPGQSGNPGGRPLKIKEAENILLENLKKATEKISKLVDSEDDRVSLQASVQVMERMMGKAVQKVENKDTTDAKQIDEADLVNIATAGSAGTTET